jgi:hypothetical protein
MATRLLGFRVRIPPIAWMCVVCECCERWLRERTSVLRYMYIASPDGFSFILFNNLKSFERKKYFVYIKYSFCRPLGICPLGRPQHSLSPQLRLRMWQKQSCFFSSVVIFLVPVFLNAVLLLIGRHLTKAFDEASVHKPMK